MPTGTIQSHGLPDLNGPYKKTYDVTFLNKTIFTTVTASPEAVDDWIQELQSIKSGSVLGIPVALDTERGPYEDRIATIQFCVGHYCLVFQIGRSPSIPPSLVNFLSDARNTFFGIHLNDKILCLQSVFRIINSGRFIDLGRIVADQYKMQELRHSSLAEFTLMVLGVPLEMPQVDVHWNREELSEEQVHYACLEASLVYEIVRILAVSR